MEKEYILKTKEDGTIVTVKDVQKVLLSMIKDIDHICRKYDIPYFLMGGSALGAIRHKGFIPWDDDMDIAMMKEDYVRFVEVLKKEFPNDTYYFHCFETNKEYNVLIPAMKIRKKHTYVEEVNTLLKNKCDGDGLFIDVFVIDYVNENKYIDFMSRLFTYPMMFFITLLENMNFNPYALKKLFVKYARSYGERNKNSSLIGLDLCWTFRNPLKPIVYKKKDVYPVVYHPFEDTALPIPNNIHPFLDASISKNHMSLPKEKDRQPKHIKDIDLGGNEYAL